MLVFMVITEKIFSQKIFFKTEFILGQRMFRKEEKMNEKKNRA